MKKKNILVIVLTLICISGTIMSFDNPKQEEPYRNLRILPKNSTKKQVDSTMDYFTASLGVRCGFCHARKADTTKRGLDFESDAKEEKSTARDMMTMTKFLNLNYFDPNHSARKDTLHTITCYTCHRGNNEPTEKNLRSSINAIMQEKHKK